MSRSIVYHFISEEETFEHRLQQRLKTCRKSILASAFFTFGALRSLKPALQEALESKARITFLLGRFDFVTEPRAVDALLRLSKRFPAQLKVYFDADFGFHFKLATFKVGRDETVIIGSSNLTLKGLSTIGEANLEISGNRIVYKQANELLERQLKIAINAENASDDYRRLYNRAKKYRQQRRRWINRGQKKWAPKRRSGRQYLQPQERRFAFCRIDEEVLDERLIENVGKEHDRATARGLAFPCQWVQLDKQSAPNFAEDEKLVVCDNVSNRIGFAICTRKVSILDEKGKPQPVIFYRYLRGWKAGFGSKMRFDQVVRRLGFSNRAFIGSGLSERLKAYLQKRRRR